MGWSRPLVLGCALALGCFGCGSDDEDDAEPATGAVATISERCVPVSSDFTTPLGNGMKDMEVRIKNAHAVESGDRDDVYFVSAELYGGDVADGTVGTWATTSLGGAEAIWTVDDVSKQYSALRDGTEVADLAMVSGIGHAVQRVTGLKDLPWVDIHVQQEPEHVAQVNEAIEPGFSPAEEETVVAAAEEMWRLWIAFFDRLRHVMFAAREEAVAAGG